MANNYGTIHDNSDYCKVCHCVVPNGFTYCGTTCERKYQSMTIDPLVWTCTCGKTYDYMLKRAYRACRKSHM
jgi:hypothetical protein